jgi:hypothetical protein
MCPVQEHTARPHAVLGLRPSRVQGICEPPANPALAVEHRLLALMQVRVRQPFVCCVCIDQEPGPWTKVVSVTGAGSLSGLPEPEWKLANTNHTNQPHYMWGACEGGLGGG